MGVKKLVHKVAAEEARKKLVTADFNYPFS